MDEDTSANDEANKFSLQDLMQEAATFYRAKRYREALKVYEKALQVDHNQVDAYVGQGDCFRKLRHDDDVLNAYRSALQIDPNNPFAYIGMCCFYARWGYYEEAFKAYERAIQLDPTNASAYGCKGYALYRQQRYEEALEAFDDAIRLAVDNKATYYFRKYRIYLKLERYQDAIEACAQAIHLEPENESYQRAMDFMKREQQDIFHLLGKGKDLYYQYEYEEALNIYNEILQRDSKNAPAHLGKGKALLKLRQYRDAIQTFDEALQINAKYAEAHAGKGHAFFALNSDANALKSYVNADKLSSCDIDFHHNAGIILARMGHYQDAIQFCRKALRLDPPRVSVYITLGDTLFTIKEYSKASETYEQAFQGLQQQSLTPDELWLLTLPIQSCQRPAYISLTLYQLFVSAVPGDLRANLAFQSIGKLYNDLFDANTVQSDILYKHLGAIQAMLISLTEEAREDALLEIAQKDEKRIAHLLIYLAPAMLKGFTSLARRVITQWHHDPHDQEYVIDLYQIADAYHVPSHEADWFLAQSLLARECYSQAEVLLARLVEDEPTSGQLWSWALVLRQLGQSPEREVKVLEGFVTQGANDAQLADAYLRIGDLYGEYLGDGIKAVEAYKKSEALGLHIPKLQAFHEGDWDRIPALRTHPDYPFPPIVALDLESDYMPGSEPGSRVFEIGAVRVKGNTELDDYNAVIQRNFIAQKVAQHQREAKPLEVVVKELQIFIDLTQARMKAPILVGHNLQQFDMPHLRAMGVVISNEQVIDTLVFARLLYPDSLHHHLRLLCDTHAIPFQGQAHTALPDARACARLLHALGEELIQRGERLITGFRAFVSPDSAFDRAILQPRKIATDPYISWDLDPAPTTPHALVSSTYNSSPSPCIHEALESSIDALIERYDTGAAYVYFLPTDQRSTVTVNDRARLERMLAVLHERTDVFVLPDPRFLLCPHRLRKCIELVQNPQTKLTLFCLYQASHNHDAQTLYPLRLPSEFERQISYDDKKNVFTTLTEQRAEASFEQLKFLLLYAYCTSEWQHDGTCIATEAVRNAMRSRHVLLATHESFLQHAQHPYWPDGKRIIIDDADKLQMHLAEYVAERITSEQIVAWSEEIFTLLHAQLCRYVKENISNPAFHERLYLRQVEPYLRSSQGGNLLTRLKEHSHIGAYLAGKLENFCLQALRDASNNTDTDVHADWVDLWFSQQPETSDCILERWSFCGLHLNLQKAFQSYFWEPYQQHILCGTALSLSPGDLGTVFLRRFFGLNDNIRFLQDERPPSQVYIPYAQEIRPPSFLARKLWAQEVGYFLYKVAHEYRRSLVVTLHTSSIVNALATTFKESKDRVPHQILSPCLGWASTKIADRLARSEPPAMALLSPRLRETILDDAVDIEVTGPIRFLNQHDPIVAAQIRFFAAVYKDDGPISTYLLPQALLELKARLSSQAKIHIVLDSSLRAKVYRDEFLSLFKDGEILDTLPGVVDKVVSTAFSELLAENLDKNGLSTSMTVSDATLHQTLHAFWGVEEFRKSPLDQKTVVRGVFEGRDQLVVAATGGGKSLCFQLPALLLAQDVVPKVTLIFSPLIALMRDQVEVLRSKGIFQAIALNSAQSQAEKRDYRRGLKQGDYSIIYVAPEQIHSSALREALEYREVGLIALDEAHCVSQWGHDFRTDYFGIKKWIEEVICKRTKRTFPILALTATARKGYAGTINNQGEKSTIKDIIDNTGLRLKEQDVCVTSPDRPELAFHVEQIHLLCLQCSRPLELDRNRLCLFCRNPYDGNDSIKTKIPKVASLLAQRGKTGLRERWDRPYGRRQRGLIYCALQATTREVAEGLKNHPDLKGLRIEYYHAKRGENESNPGILAELYKRFISDNEDGLDIIVATNAFGMGIDVRRLGFVIHFDIPGTPEAYYQEAGRAGRDPSFNANENQAQCILLYHENDLEQQRKLSSQNTITKQDIEATYQAFCKLKFPGEQELLVTKQTISLITGIEEKQINTVLYYLERYRDVSGNSVIEYRGNASRILKLKFVAGYQSRLVRLSSCSQQLAAILCAPGKFNLHEKAVIDLYELANDMNWDTRLLEDEIAHLKRNQIIVNSRTSRIRLLKDFCDIYSILNYLKDFIEKLFGDTKGQGRLREKAVNLRESSSGYKENMIPLTTLAHFLFMLSRRNIGLSRLFSYFKRDDEMRIPDSYKFKLSDEGSILEIFRQLCYCVAKLEEYALTSDWQDLDILERIKDLDERRDFERSLLLLMTLDVLTYAPESSIDIAMRIAFVQDHPVSADQLSIDLSSLSLKRRQTERKLELMKEFATVPPEERLPLLRSYFLGETPLFRG